MNAPFLCPLALLVAALAPAQTIIPVTSLANTGTGTLRAAITAANAATNPIIDVQVAGTITLQSALPLLSASRAITIRRTGTSGRLVIDARTPTAGAAGTGLFVQGAGAQLLAPLTILVTNGVGLRVSAANVRIDDVEVQGASQNGFWGYGAPGLQVTRLRISGAGIGVRLDDCDGSQLGIGNGVVEVVDSTNDGIMVTSSNSDVAIRSFVLERNNIGLLALAPTRLSLGSNGSPRSRAADNRSYGLNLMNLTNGTAVALQNADVTGNGNWGVSVGGGSDVEVEDCRIAENLVGGLEFTGSTLRPRLRRSLVERNYAGGIAVWGIGTAAIENTTVRQNLGIGITLSTAPGVVVGPGNRVDDNWYTGVFVLSCPDLQYFDNPSLARNRGVGMDVRQSPRSRIRGSTFAENDGISLWLRDGSNDTTVGPGVIVRDTRGTGINIESVGNTLIHGSSILGNTVFGIQCITDGRTLAPNRVLSCLIAHTDGIGLMLRNGPVLRCEFSTIVDNIRGVYATQIYAGQQSRIELESCIVWGNSLEDHSTTAPDGVVVPRNSFFQIPAPSGNGNRNSNPLFLDLAAGDFRLRRGSPAMDTGSTTVALPAGTTDAWGQARVVGSRIDCGAHEVPTSQPFAPMLTFFPDFMPAGGGDVTFTANYPATDAGALAVLLLELDGPTGEFPALGTTIPLALSPALFALATDARASGTLALVPPDGTVHGSLAFANRLPAAMRDVVLAMVGVTMDGTPAVRTVTNVATVRVR